MEEKNDVADFDQQIENQDEEQVEETTQEVEETTEDVAEDKPKETPEARLARLERQAKQLRKKLGIEDEVKAEEKPKPKPKPKQEDATLDVEAKILKVAKGFSHEEIEYAQKIAKVEGVDLTDAIGTDLFVSWKEKRDKEVDAELRASRGGAVKRQEKTFKTPQLSADEHKKLWQRTQRQ